MRSLPVVLSVAVALAGSACRKSSPEPSPAGQAATEPRHRDLLTRFAGAIVARDYAAAHGLVAADARADLTLEDLEEAFQHYREGLPDQLKTEVELDAYDREAALLVPENLRGRIDAEGTIHFEPGGDAEGFSAHVWIMRDAGEPRLAHFYVGD